VTRYRLILQFDGPAADAAIALRMALKTLLRRFNLKAIDVRPADPDHQQCKPTGADGSFLHAD